MRVRGARLAKATRASDGPRPLHGYDRISCKVVVDNAFRFSPIHSVVVGQFPPLPSIRTERIREFSDYGLLRNLSIRKNYTFGPIARLASCAPLGARAFACGPARGGSRTCQSGLRRLRRARAGARASRRARFAAMQPRTARPRAVLRAAPGLDRVISFIHRRKMRSGKIHELPKGNTRIIIDTALLDHVLRAVMKVLWKGRDFFPICVWKIIVTVNCAIDVSPLPVK